MAVCLSVGLFGSVCLSVCFHIVSGLVCLQDLSLFSIQDGTDGAFSDVFLFLSCSKFNFGAINLGRSPSSQTSELVGVVIGGDGGVPLPLRPGSVCIPCSKTATPGTWGKEKLEAVWRSPPGATHLPFLAHLGTLCWMD